MSDILNKIVDVKREEVAAARKRISLEAVRFDAESRVLTRDFVGALRGKILVQPRRFNIRVGWIETSPDCVAEPQLLLIDPLGVGSRQFEQLGRIEPRIFQHRELERNINATGDNARLREARSDRGVELKVALRSLGLDATIEADRRVIEIVAEAIGGLDSVEPQRTMRGCGQEKRETGAEHGVTATVCVPRRQLGRVARCGGSAGSRRPRRRQPLSRSQR